MFACAYARFRLDLTPILKPSPLAPSLPSLSAGHDQPSSAAAFPQEAAEQQPKVAEASQGSLVFGWPWASSPAS